MHNSLVLDRISFAQDLEGHKQSVQIIHIKERTHWAALHFVQSEIFLYDSLFTSISEKTLELIARLVKTKEKSFNVSVMNVNKQTGSVDCGLYAIAAVTCMLFNEDPTGFVFDQKELRLHFVKILETKSISSFPVLKTRRPVE